MTDEEIIKALCSSAAEQGMALKHLYRYKGTEFKRYFHYKGIPTQSCEDVLQDVILNIVSGAKNFRGTEGISDNSANAWMWTIARNRLNDHLLRNGKENNRAGGAMNDDDWSTRHRKELEQGELQLIEDQELRRQQLEIDICVSNGIEDFCAEFPDRSKVLMMQMDGESIESISQRIGRTAAATKEYLSQCRMRLKPFIEHCRPLLAG